MVENGWKLHLDPELNFVNKSDELLVLMLGDNLKDAMLWLAAYLATVGVAVATFARCLFVTCRSQAWSAVLRRISPHSMPASRRLRDGDHRSREGHPRNHRANPSQAVGEEEPKPAGVSLDH